MKKTSIYIEPDVDVALARRAAAEGTTKAELIRQALREAAGGLASGQASGAWDVPRPCGPRIACRRAPCRLGLWRAVIVIDTSVVVAFMNASDDSHAAVAGWLDALDDDLATTPLIVAEVDHLVGARGGRAAQRALHRDLAAGAYLLEWWPGAIAAMVKVAERYGDTGLGLADASLVALAERLGTVEIATLDERHFRAVRPLAGANAFRLLPADT